jgi:hypothetical protein
LHRNNLCFFLRRANVREEKNCKADSQFLPRLSWWSSAQMGEAINFPEASGAFALSILQRERRQQHSLVWRLSREQQRPLLACCGNRDSPANWWR